jgi:formamidopyrimidine-DNA glycosylase
MPELPEVETIRRGLSERLIGRVIVAVEVRAPQLFTGDPERLKGKTVDTVERRGKLLIIGLNGGLAFTVHLKMTGQLIWVPEAGPAGAVVGGHPEAAYLASLPHKHTHIIFSFDDQSHLYFNDLRKFGRVVVVETEKLPEDTFMRKLGPEPLEKSFTRDYLENRLRQKAKTPVKAFLLDQENIAGLGNIYADESLFRAAILPYRRAGELTTGEARNLYDAIQETLELALLYGGSSEKDYLNAVGEKGTFLRIANVYHRTGLDCHRCNAGTVQRLKIAGRSSHYCPVCQR